MVKLDFLSVLDEKAQFLYNFSDGIWADPETAFTEFHAAGRYCSALRSEGFEVTENLAGIPTAFSGRFGSGHPVIGVLAEFDALSGLSQEGGVTEKRTAGGACGHGCGHNLLGTASLGAAIAIKRFLETQTCSGTVILFGCPGEEGGAAKAFMARDNLWHQLDAALTWHPEDSNEVITGSSNSCIQVQYTFHGIASHAAGAPDRGRSALDAVELMNIGVQFLREHMSDKARIHYAITDAGGRSPNVVQPRSTVLYMVRSNHVSEAIELQKRVDKIADGAALMTETTYDRKFIDGLADTVPNHVLEALLHRNFAELGVPGHTAEELAFADALSRTYEGAEGIPGIGSKYDSAYAQNVKALRAEAGHAMNDFLLPLYSGAAFRPGSTDVGDVSWECPTAQISVAAWPNGCPGHSWQNVSCDGTDIGRKAAVHAGKVIAAAAIDLFADPSILDAARAEFAEKTAEGYTCPIPADAVPTIAD